MKSRNFALHGVDRPDDRQLIEQISTTDLQNTIWLEEIIERQGLPGVSEAGGDGAHALCLLIQHSPDLEFQKRCLSLMDVWVLQGELEPMPFA